MPGFECIGQEELEEVQRVFENGGVLFRHGFEALRNNYYAVKDFEVEFGRKMACPNTLAVTSGTAALRVALAALRIGKGDEVICPAFTFVATVEAVIESGATPVCIDIDKSLNMCPKSLEMAVTEKTKAVIVVHMLGTPARLEELKEVCESRNIRLIEDTAWGCGGHLKGKALGTWGDAGTYSFDYAKTITTGEGGMVVFKDKRIRDLGAAWHDHGHENNPRVPRWEDTRKSSGFNYRMSELQGAVGLAQLKKLDFVVSRQRHNASLIWKELDGISEIESREEPDGAYGTADGLVFLANSPQIASACRESLVLNGIGTKILPEALKWHFAGEWEHIPEIGAKDRSLLRTSQELLERSVCIPVSTRMHSVTPAKISSAVKSAITGRS